jgi:EAL domain-containing protein (putative c-di-GMP-specific phosphodiesterase class I)
LVRLSGLGRVTESLGQESCELFLAEFEDRLQRTIRPVDKLVAVATDKYAIHLSGVHDRNHIELAVAKLLREFDPPAEIVGERVFFEVNAGFVVPDGEPASSKQRLRQAETALRLAMTSGRSAVVVEPSELTPDQADPKLLPRVEQAIEQGEFQLHYQCKVDAGFMNVIGAEGLVRWHDQAERKVVMPNVFIEQVERSDLIKPLTEHLLRSAISRCATWSEPQSVAVNVPPSLFNSPDVVAVVGDALSCYDLDAQRLVIEVTERGEMPAHAFVQLEALRDTGVKIAIDDFGTGHCSLSYFRDLPADQVKIDGSFVRAMSTSAKDRAIVRGCIDLAHYCDLSVVAEGVEDEQTAEQLREFGCDVLQGYWFGKPMLVDEYEREHLAGMSRMDGEEDHFSSLLAP